MGPVPEQNVLLASLPAVAKKRFFSRLELVDLALGDVVYEPGQPVKFVYFPINSIISLLYVMRDGASAEISVVGFEGMVGIAVFMGGESTPGRAVVQSAGPAYRMTAMELKQAFNADVVIRELLLRFTQAQITQLAQTAICNRHHSIEKQLCRWLLLSLDRLADNRVIMTQELIANMLGVRREGVTEAAGKLQKLGVIKYRRGEISVIDRPALEAISCECYEVVEREVERLASYNMAN